MKMTQVTYLVCLNVKTNGRGGCVYVRNCIHGCSCLSRQECLGSVSKCSYPNSGLAKFGKVSKFLADKGDSWQTCKLYKFYNIFVGVDVKQEKKSSNQGTSDIHTIKKQKVPLLVRLKLCFV